MFACWYTSLQVETRIQNDWSVTNQIEYTGFRQDSYFEYICRLFYHKGLALNNILVQRIRHKGLTESTLLLCYLIFSFTSIAFDDNHFTQWWAFYAYTQGNFILY